MTDLWIFLRRLLFIFIAVSLVYGFVHLMDKLGSSRILSGVIIVFIFFILVKLNKGRKI